MLKFSSLCLALVSISFLIKSPLLRADDLTEAWNTFTVNAPLLSDGSLRLGVEAQQRTLDRSRRTDKLIYRTWIEHEAAPNWWVAAGYLYMDTYPDGVVSGRALEEHRPWQQLLYQTTLWGNPSSYHLRLEERFIEGKRDEQYRARMLMRTGRRLGEELDYGVALFNEVLVNIDKNDRGDDAGFDQNRAFIGVYASMNPVVRVEVGYLNVVIHRYLRERQQIHGVRTAITVRF